MQQFILLLLSGTCSALASILLRLAGKLSAYGDAALFLGMGSRPLLYRLTAVCAYGAGFVLYALALKRIELDIVNYDVRLRDNYDGRSTGVIVAVNWL
jgi:small multidrug resistance pump